MVEVHPFFVCHWKIETRIQAMSDFSLIPVPRTVILEPVDTPVAESIESPTPTPAPTPTTQDRPPLPPGSPPKAKAEAKEEAPPPRRSQRIKARTASK